MAGLRGWLWRPVDPTIMFPMLISLVFSSQMIFSYMPEWGPFACLISIALSCGVVVSIPAQNARGLGFDSQQRRLLRARHCTIFFPLSWLRSFLIRYSVTLFRYVFPLHSIIQLHTNSCFLPSIFIWVGMAQCIGLTSKLLFRYVIPLRYSVTFYFHVFLLPSFIQIAVSKL